MTTRQLHCAVSRATGEDIDLIAQRGFSLVEDERPDTDDDWAAMALDWHRLDAERREHRPIAA